MSTNSRPRPRIRRQRATIRQTQRCFELLTTISAAADNQTAIQLTARGTCEILVADSCVITLLQADADPSIFSYTASDVALPVQVDRAVIERTQREKRPLIVPIDHQSEQRNELQRSIVKNVPGLLSIPILSHELVVGMIFVERTSRSWLPGEMRLAQTIAVQLGHYLERTRLIEALEYRAQELAAVYDTAVAISGQLDLPATLHNIVEQATRLARADSGGLYLCDEAQGELEVVVSYHLDHDYRGERIKLGEGLAGRAAISGQVETVVDYVTWPDRARTYATAPFHAVLAVPLLQEGQVLGVLDLVHQTPTGRFNESDIAVVKLFAAQAVVAIANARLYDHAHQYADRMSALARASQLLDAQGNMAASIQPLAQEGVVVLGAQACLVLLYDSKATPDMYYVGLSADEALIVRQTLEQVSPTMPSSGIKLQHDPVNNLLDHESETQSISPTFRSSITLPLTREEQSIGSVTYLYAQPHLWNKDDVEVAQVVANQMAAMVTNAQLYHEVHEANRLKAEFVSTMSHELRTPMGAIIGYTDMLLTGLYGGIPNSVLDPLSRVKTNADHLLTLINQILDLSRIEARRLELHDEPFNPRDLIQSVRTMMQPLAVAKSLHFRSDVARDVPSIVLGDVGRLRQILINLVGNSVKFTQQGLIEMRCSINTAETPQLVFEVTDTGMGIPEEQLATIWEPFRQGDSSVTRKFGGTGLGLAIVRKLTELMQGSATVHSVAGRGTTFTIQVPLRVPVRPPR